MIYEIESTSNAKYKYIKSLAQKKARTESGCFCVEGIKSVNDALRSGFVTETVAVSREFYNLGIIPDTDVIYIINDNIFPQLCDTKNPQGILSVLKMRNDTFSPVKGNIYVYCDHISDPGNLGTVIRTADASGMDAVLMSPECVDLYSPKTIRSSMGSYFHIPVYENITADMLNSYKKDGFKILSSDLSDNTTDYRKADYTGAVVLILGNEANGITDDIKKISDEFIKIPILGKAESLNVSVAGGILMYEAVRKRQN